jgi:hypothetical protein
MGKIKINLPTNKKKYWDSPNNITNNITNKNKLLKLITWGSKFCSLVSRPMNFKFRPIFFYWSMNYFSFRY